MELPLDKGLAWSEDHRPLALQVQLVSKMGAKTTILVSWGAENFTNEDAVEADSFLASCIYD